jgi:LTXXQ motif family protein
MKTALLLMWTVLLCTHSALAQPVAAREPDRAELAKQLADEFVARTARVKVTLRLTPEQSRNWSDFESELVAIGKTRAQRVIALRSARQKRPFDVVEQIRIEADFTKERGAEQKKLADAAEPLIASLNDQQRRRFGEQLFAISRALGSD